MPSSRLRGCNHFTHIPAGVFLSAYLRDYIIQNSDKSKCSENAVMSKVELFVQGVSLRSYLDCIFNNNATTNAHIFLRLTEILLTKRQQAS